MTESDRGAARSNQDLEIHHATIVKCDIVESTRTLRRFDSGDGSALQDGSVLEDQCRKIVEEVVARYEGHFDRWDGDGALIHFGYPDTREDAPRRAVRAALELVEEVCGVRASGVPVQLRVGVASGAVTIKLDSKQPGGLVINMAERLRALAEPGWVVIADETRQLTASHFECDDLGTREAKGFDEGLRAWRVVQETSVARRRARGEIIGRAIERAGAGGLMDGRRAAAGDRWCALSPTREWASRDLRGRFWGGSVAARRRQTRDPFLCLPHATAPCFL